MSRSENEWRQGDMLSTQHFIELFVPANHVAGQVAIIISHDCDLPHESEPHVEVILGELVNSVDPEYSRAKHPRKLHLTYSSHGTPIHVELRQSNRCNLDRSRFFATERPSSTLMLSDDEKRGLKLWLAARYGRPAFPTSFQNRLAKAHRKKAVKKQIAKVLYPIQKSLVALFFDLGDERTTELDEGIPYYLSITLVYDATEGAENGRIHADKAAIEIRSIFQNAYGAPDKSTEIVLDRCDAVADTKITLADIRRVDQWSLEYMSLQEDPPDPYIAFGGLPA